MLNSLRLFLASFLSVLLFALTLNAYACLLPINSATPTPMANGCSTPDEQPSFPYCEIFKTLDVHSTGTLPLGGDDPALCQADTISLAHHVIVTSRNSRLSDYLIAGSPQDLLLKISVLRI